MIDFSATPLDDFKILLEWTVPGVYLAEEGLGNFIDKLHRSNYLCSSYFNYLHNSAVNVDSYSIKQSDDFFELLNNFDNAEYLIPPDEIPPPGDAWNHQSITFTYGEHADRYFALKAKTLRSGPNPVLQVIYLIRFKVLI